MRLLPTWGLLCLSFWFNSLAHAVEKEAVAIPVPTALAIEPTGVTIRGADNQQQLVVTGTVADQSISQWDFTRSAQYQIVDPKVAKVSAHGVIKPISNGETEVQVRVGTLMVSAKVVIRDFEIDPPVSFRNQIEPILTKFGCNAGGCHGKQLGQNNFKLSLLGFDHDYDYNALVKEARGRRIFAAAPEQSLLLLKSSGGMPHGGGAKIRIDSPEYELVRRWVRQGTPAGSNKDPYVDHVEVFPKARVLTQHGHQQLLVTAFYSDGTVRDVTHEAHFKSSDTNLANVDEAGSVSTDKGSGDTAIMARFMGQVQVFHVTIPLTNRAQANAIPKKNYVDEHVQAKWKQLNLIPSPLADDATFLRRAYLDCIGTLPTPEEIRAFQADQAKDKRERVIDQLLARNEYADFWAIKWGDLLRNQRKNSKENIRGTFAFHAWIRNALSTNMPYDQFVRNIIAAQGTVDQHPPVIWYRTVRNLTHQTNDTAQLFLGMRISCAQCHHHPYEKWSQDDYYQLQAFFGRMGRKAGETAQEPAIFVKQDGTIRNPASNKVMKPRGLDGPDVEISEDEDPRHKLVDWMSSPTNPFFARAIANRMWGHFMSRGLVEPVDDMRVTNPPSNPELLDALAKDFIEHKFDLKHLIRVIMTSSAYQLSSDPLPENMNDQQNYARAYPRRMQAEVMLDAISQVTGVQENFGGLPKNVRAIQLPDESVGSYFLEIFGRPGRETACECERPREANLSQALHLLNSTELQTKFTNKDGRLALLLKANKKDDEILDELYLWALGRSPRAQERETARTYLTQEPDRKTAFEDMLWAILNTKEFLFNH